jgi:ATP-dependent Clp protease protease subunit
MNDLYVKHTGQTLDTIERAMERDKFLNAEEAKAFGLIDAVVDKRPTTLDGDAAKAA